MSTAQPEIQTISIDQLETISRIKRRTSEAFNEIDSKVASIKPNQLLVQAIPRTKKGDLNRQYSVKVAKHLGDKFTTLSRMGNEKIKGQSPDELYLYIYLTPIQTPKTVAPQVSK